MAAVIDGMSRRDAARIGGMDRQTLRDWAHRFNLHGPDGLLDNWTKGPASRLTLAQQQDLAAIVEAGPDREKDGIVRWRRIDLKHVIKEGFGVDYHERHVGTLLKRLGFSASPISAQGRDTPLKAARSSRPIKKLHRDAEGASWSPATRDADRNLVPG